MGTSEGRGRGGGRIYLWSGRGRPRIPGAAGPEPVDARHLTVPEVAVLRNTNEALHGFALAMVGFLLLPTSWVVLGGESSWDALIITLAVMLVMVPYLLRRFFWRYTIRGDVLEIRTLFRRIKIDLPAVDAVALRQIDVGNGKRALMLILDDEDVRIRLGDGTSASFFEPEALNAVAVALQKSPHTGPHEVGVQLQRLAVKPSFDSWPD